jgi:3-phosphoglycerate kinase
MGQAKLEPFAGGTRAVADTLASQPGTTVTAGGEAAREVLEGRELPGLAVLPERVR